MKKITFSVLIAHLLLSPFPTLSQKNYSQGYIVKAPADTTHGLIHYKGWDRNPKTISFMTGAGGEKVVYGPDAILAFSVANEHYISAIVDVDISPFKTHELAQNPEPEYEKQSVFLQSLFRGEKSLLYLKDENAKEHFFIDNNGYKPLVYKRYYRLVDTQGITSRGLDENVEFKRQLFFYLTGCPQLQTKIESATYQSTSLTKLFTNYHECINKSAKYVNERSGVAVEAGVLAGATMTTVRFSGDRQTFYHIIGNNYNKALTPSIGVFLNARLIRTRGLKITNDLFFTSFHIEGTGTGTFSQETRASFDYHYLKVQNMIQFDLLRDGLLYVAAGASSGIMTKDNELVTIRYSSSVLTQRKFEPRRFEFGSVAGIGSTMGRFTADIRYERSTGFSDYATLAAKTRRLHFLLKYRISNQK